MATQHILAASFKNYKQRVDRAFKLVAKGKTNQLFRLIGGGLSVNTTNSDGLTLLHCAAGYGHTNTVVQLLHHGAKKAMVAGAFGTPLHQAAMKGHLSTVKVMLTEGCPVDVMSNKGDSVLHFAAAGGIVEVIKEVWGAGCDLNAKDRDGETPLHCAAGKGNTEASVALIRSGAKKAVVAGVLGTPLHLAAMKGHLLTVNALLDEGCPVDVVSRSCASVLHFAAISGDVEVIKVVLDAGCYINARDKSGMTPLHWAARSGRTEAVLELIRVGAEVNIVAGKCGIPLHQAAMLGNESTVRAMLKAGCPVDVVDVDGSSVLHFAAYGGQVCIIQLLVEFGLNVQQRDNYGLTPFHYAILFGHLECVKALLQLGADPGVQSPMFGSAMNLAQICGRRDIEDMVSSFAEEGTQPATVYDSILQLSTQPPESVAMEESPAILSEGESGISQFEHSLFVAINDNRLRTMPNMAFILAKLSKQQRVDLHKIACLAAIHGDVTILELLMTDTTTARAYTKPMYASSILDQFFPHLMRSRSKDILQHLVPPECAMNPLVLAIISLNMCSKQRKYHIFMQQSSRNHMTVIKTLVTNNAFCNTLNEPLANGLTPLDLAERFELREAATIIMKAGGKNGIWANLPREVQQHSFALCQSVTALKGCGKAGKQALQMALKLTGCVSSAEENGANHQVVGQRPDLPLISQVILPRVNLDVWEEVGALLQVPQAILKELDQYQSKVRNKYHKVLTYWLDHSETASWRKLFEVLSYFETKHMVEELTRSIHELQKVRLQRIIVRRLALLNPFNRWCVWCVVCVVCVCGVVCVLCSVCVWCVVCVLCSVCVVCGVCFV